MAMAQILCQQNDTQKKNLRTHCSDPKVSSEFGDHECEAAHGFILPWFGRSRPAGRDLEHDVDHMINSAAALLLGFLAAVFWRFLGINLRFH